MQRRSASAGALTKLSKWLARDNLSESDSYSSVESNPIQNVELVNEPSPSNTSQNSRESLEEQPTNMANNIRDVSYYT